MVKLSQGGAYLLNGTEVVEVSAESEALLKSKLGSKYISKEEAAKNTIAYDILESHNTSGNMEKLQIKFDKLTSHDITFVGIIQTARASGLEKFPIPYVLTNCHNSLCAVGGTINEDDHMFGLTCAKKYGGVYVPPHQAVIHQFAREMLAGGGKMILGSDSHTRYGALGTMAMGEGGPELVKQLLSQTYDINMPGVVAIYLTGSPAKGVGPQDVALAIIGAVFGNGYVKNKVMEFVGPGVASLSADFRIGVDVMTTETTCLSSIWQTDEKIKEFYDVHGRVNEYKELNPGEVAYYDGVVYVDLSKIKPMIAMPFHPSNTYTIDEVNANLMDILHDVEKRALVSLDGKVDYKLTDKVRNGKLYVEQGIIAGCAGGGFENICDAADILKGKYIGADEFTLSVYPASTPIYVELARNGRLADLMQAGAIVKTAFCGPCFGAGDTPSNNALSIRHSTRNFPNREGSKLQNGQISSVALMDARSIAATAANKGYLTSATDLDMEYTSPKYHFDSAIYANRVFDSKGVSDPSVEIKFGPNIKDWPKMIPLTENALLKVVSEIHDPVTTTDELIPSGETSSYRSNPLGLAEFTLSRRDPEYVGKAKEVQAMEKMREEG
ncbi:MAG: hydratase, partial [Lachnospiraceae bacterium]|nr:hydratase [Lachnospiraceae bacterium]